MDCYTQTFPIARKVHKCDFCGKQIEKGEKYFRQSWKDGGEFCDSKLCLVCEKMIERYSKERKCDDEYTYDAVSEWLHGEYCYYCENCKECEYDYEEVQECPHIRKHFESLDGDEHGQV